MSNYLQAGELFRKMQQTEQNKLQLDRQFHNGDSATRYDVATQISEAMQEINAAVQALHGLGFSTKVEKASNRWQTVKLLDNGEEVSSFEIERF